MQIPIKPLSVNSKFTINQHRRRIVKSTSCTKFEKSILGYLNKYATDINIFRNSFNPKNEALHLEIIMYVPKEEFFTKAGTVSLTSIDASNALKMLEDTIYKAMGINDGLNLKVSSEKRPINSDEWLTLIMITKVEKPKIDPLDNLTHSH